MLAEGYTTSRIQEEYPDIKQEDISGALQFAADMVQFEERSHARVSD